LVLSVLFAVCVLVEGSFKIHVAHQVDGWRYLVFEGLYQSAVMCKNLKGVPTPPDGSIPKDCEPDPSQLQFGYTQTALLGLLFLDQTKNVTNFHRTARVLILGLGAGSLPNFLSHFYPDMKIDVVELNPEVIRLAKEYFGFLRNPNPNLNVINAEASAYIASQIQGFSVKNKNRYDIIMMDCANENEMIPQLNGVPFLRNLRSLLTDNGIAIGNVFRVDPHLMYTYTKNYQEAFGTVWFFWAYERVLCNSVEHIGVCREKNHSHSKQC